MSIWIKICSNTSLDDALLSAEAGADAVGFIFARSKRRVTVEQVVTIVPHLPAALEKIGVFVDADIEEIAATVNACGLTGVQLHFDAPPELPTALRTRFGPELGIIRVVHFGAGAVPELPDHPHIDSILVDSCTPTATGGTGQTFDWGAAANTLFQDGKASKRLVAAGGLTPENVAEAIATLRPWGVDVATGVEAAPGFKDPAKLRAFIANARAARR
jgi:phosphoribosylanthranilate isomerase